MERKLAKGKNAHFWSIVPKRIPSDVEAARKAHSQFPWLPGRIDAEFSRWKMEGSHPASSADGRHAAFQRAAPTHSGGHPAHADQAVARAGGGRAGVAQGICGRAATRRLRFDAARC